MSRLTTETMRPFRPPDGGRGYSAPSSPFSSAVTAAKMIGRRGRLPRPAHRAGDLDQGGDAGGIVHRAIVDPVGLPARRRARVADADMVEMRHQQHIFAGERRIGAGQDRDHVGARERVAFMPLARDMGALAEREAARPGPGPRRFVEDLRRAGAGAPWNRVSAASSPKVAAKRRPGAVVAACRRARARSWRGGRRSRRPRVQGAAALSARVRMVIMPMAPRAAAMRRLSALRWAATSLGVPAGVPFSTTTIFPRTSSPR